MIMTIDGNLNRIYTNASFIFGGITLLFLINPFFSLLAVLFMLIQMKWSMKEYRCLLFVALFLALLAYTQQTTVGDISRTYRGVKRISDTPVDTLARWLFSAYHNERNYL